MPLQISNLIFKNFPFTLNFLQWLFNSNLSDHLIKEPCPILYSFLIRHSLSDLLIRTCKIMVKYNDRSHRFFWFNRCVDLVNLEWLVLVTVLWIVHVHRQVDNFLPWSMLIRYQWFRSFNDWSFMHLLLSSHSFSLNQIGWLWCFIFHIFRAGGSFHWRWD